MTLSDLLRPLLVHTFDTKYLHKSTHLLAVHLLRVSPNGNKIWQDLKCCVTIFCPQWQRDCSQTLRSLARGCRRLAMGALGRQPHTRTHTRIHKLLLTENFPTIIFLLFSSTTNITSWRLSLRVPVLLISIHMSRVCLKDLVNCHQSKGTACAFFFSPHLCHSWQAACLEMSTSVWFYEVGICSGLICVVYEGD